MMTVKTHPVGPLAVNCFIVFDSNTKEGFVIDPGDEPEMIIDIIDKENVLVKYIVLTHGHFDHIGAVGELKEATKGRILIHPADEEVYKHAKTHAATWGYQMDDLPSPDQFINEGDEIKVDDLLLKVMHTPGHTPGGVCLYGMETLFSGDTLFRDSIGRTDLPGGDMNAMGNSFRRLMKLPPETVVYCGHGLETTIGREKRENFFCSEFL